MSGRSEGVELLLKLLDEAYEKAAWHGPNLKGSLRGVTPRKASFRPSASRHSIREVVLHAAYWKYTVWRRLTGAPRGTFALSGSNWFRRPGAMSAREWKRDKALLEAEHRRLRAVVAGLRRVPARANLRQIYGVAFHDLYHTGQIQLLKRLAARA